jgi:hypothetical protein
VANGQENLIPMNKRTKEEAREYGRKGGIESGKSRQKKATMKKILEDMLNEVANVKGNTNNLTYAELVTLGLIKGATKGNAINYKTIMEVKGELNPENETKEPIINIQVKDNSNLADKFWEEEK